jgi:hypothetical protein
MNAEKAIYNILSNDASLKAQVPQSRMYAGLIPIGKTYPALCYNLISTFEETGIALTTQKLRSRVQVTCVAKTYPEVKQVVSLVIAACNHKQGVFNGVKVDSVILDGVGADFRDDDEAIFYSTVDFRIAHN